MYDLFGLMDSLESLRQRFQMMTSKQWAFLGIGGLTCIACLFLIYSRMQPPMALLWGDLELTEGAKIVSQIESMGISYSLKNNGTQLYVPQTQVHRTRMALAEKGALPQQKDTGYELLDQQDPLRGSHFLNDINRVRALEGELCRTIKTLKDVASVRVHLSIPKRDLFAKAEGQEPSAAISIKCHGQRPLSKTQAQAIQHLVASSVPQLSIHRITIVDHQGALVSRGQDGGAQDGSVWIEEMRSAYEKELAQRLQSFLARHVGQDKVEVRVSALFDRDHRIIHAKQYDPNGTVARTTQTVVNKQNGKTATVSASLDAETGSEGLPPPGGAMEALKNQEVAQYEISRTVTKQEQRPGRLLQLTIAVMVDGIQDPQKGYIPRTPAALDQIKRLACAALGFQAKRGDIIEVVNLPFIRDTMDTNHSAHLFFGLEPWHITRLLEMAIMGVTLLGLGVLVVRPLLKPQVKPILLDAPLSDPVFIETPPEPEPVKTLEERIRDAPEKAASIIQWWLYQDASL